MAQPFLDLNCGWTIASLGTNKIFFCWCCWSLFMVPNVRLIQKQTFSVISKHYLLISAFSSLTLLRFCDGVPNLSPSYSPPSTFSHHLLSFFARRAKCSQSLSRVVALLANLPSAVTHPYLMCASVKVYLTGKPLSFRCHPQPTYSYVCHLPHLK